MVVVCSKRRTVWERAHGEDRGRSFKISLCRRGSASIAAESGRQESSDKVQTATSQTTPRTSEKSNENYTKSIKNVAIIFTKSLWDVEVGQNRPWTVFGTIPWTPKVRPGRSKSGLGIPLGLPKAPGERFWACQGRSKTQLESPRAEIGAHLSWRALPKTLVDQFLKVFVAKFPRFFGSLVRRFLIVLAIVF